MRLMSTTVAGEKFGSFESFGELLSFLEGASDHKIERIWAVSAYYDIPSIKQLIDHIKSRISKRPKSELFIIIGTINSGELKDLQKMKFGNEFKEGSGIRVTNCGLLFHSKGYLVETRKNGMCAIGSMNLTRNGLRKNEEILTYSRDPDLVKEFKKYVEDCRSDDWSKEIRAVSKGEEGIRWLNRNHPRDRSMQTTEELVQRNDSNRLLSAPKSPIAPAPPFPDINDALDVRRYFGKERLNFSRSNDSSFDNERKFTLALYKLIFEECRKNPNQYKREGVTLRYCDALWRRNFVDYQTTRLVTADNNKQYRATCSVRFDAALKGEGEGLTCDVFIYPYVRGSGFRGGIGLGVHVGNINALQLRVSKLGWKNIWNNEGQYWEIYSDGSMWQVKCEKVLSAVRKAGCGRWIKKPRWSKKELVCLGKLPMAKKKATWGENSKKFLARLLHYSIIRANIKS